MEGGLRAANKERTRERLIEVALAQFEARGFDGVTVEDIAEAALVSPRTFYRYFGSKEAVLYGDQDEMLAVLRETIVTHSPAPPLAVVRAAIVVLVHRTADVRDRHLRRARLDRTVEAVGTYRRAVLLPLWEDTLASAVAERLGVDPDVDGDARPRLLAGIGVAVLISLTDALVGSDGQVDLEALVTNRFDELTLLVTEAADTAPAVDDGVPPKADTA